jgi:hypothetical protein
VLYLAVRFPRIWALAVHNSVVHNFKEARVKKITKLAIKKVTLRDLDEPMLDGMAGGIPRSYMSGCNPCVTIATCNKIETCTG